MGETNSDASKTSSLKDDLGHHETIIKAEGLQKTFKIGQNEIGALNNVDLKVNATDFIVIFGPSGCGKSTLLNIISGVDSPTKGEVEVRGTKIFSLDDDERGAFRARKMGIVHQMPFWIKSLNVIENIALPIIIQGEPEKKAKARAANVMEELKITSFAKQIPTQLSGGQQQKASLARALVTNPWIILADEPTGNLDSSSADEMMGLFDNLNRSYKRTIMLVTHNQAYWDMGTRRIEMLDGKIVKEVGHG